MFVSEELDKHLKTSATIQTESVVFAEWNLNDVDNIERLGNYRYRSDNEDSQFSTLPSTYDPIDSGGYYTGATQADITIPYGFNDQDQPTLFTTKNEKMQLLYSLEECVKHQRPRSGINKLLYLGPSANQYVDIGNQGNSIQEKINIAKRPRYYMSSRKDPFKYWTSFRTEILDGEQQEFGISKKSLNDSYYIDDAVPFVVYKENISTNKIIIKMQTNVGTQDLGPFRYNNRSVEDPLFGKANQTTPERWEIQVLKGDDWTVAMSFDQNSETINGEQIIGADGYVEISYGLDLPFEYKDVYVYAGELSDESLLPERAPEGYTFLIKENQEDLGMLKIYENEEWKEITPEYGWSLSNQQVDTRTKKVTKLSDPEYFMDNSGKAMFREFEVIRGIRIAVETMNKPECTFDLIEFSPRIFADISDKVSAISISKIMSDLGNGSVPVGSILASTGSLQLFDNDSSFNENNPFNEELLTGSIISKCLDTKTKFSFYHVTKNVNGYDYFIPIKKMYTEEIPKVGNSTGTVDITLRDLFFFLEYSKAPEILITDVSISYAVTLILDSIGFSNYVFKRIEGVPEIIIPFFFVNPDQNVAQILQELAIASQTAMFFDEYNNLVIMSKEYLLPENLERQTDSFLYGQVEGENLPNIINLSSQEKKVFNEGKIDYTSRYIQREVSKYGQINYSERSKTYGYKPSLLWEIGARKNLRTRNDPEQDSQGFALSAVPLRSTLSSEVPYVLNNTLTNNVIDLGEGIDKNLGSHQGYLYANGEIIQYDAVEYAIVGQIDDNETGNLRWIKNNQDYQRYFSKLPFNGKMYQTGNIRIYAEPEYESYGGLTRMKSGDVKKHGRGQFGTPVTDHPAGLDPYWSDNANVKGCLQKSSEFLFNTNEFIDYPKTFATRAGKTSTSVPGLSFFDSDQLSISSTRNGVIKNFRSNKYYSEKEINSFSTERVGTLQSSALVFQGPETPLGMKPSDFVSYITKELSEPYTHFGTRMRIIGKIESTNQKSATPYGAFPVYQTMDLNIDNPEKNIKILGGAGGIGFNLNKETNNGYFFEIVSLTQDNIEQYTNTEKPKVTSYTIKDVPAASCVNNIVTVEVTTKIDFVVGQKIIISGLVDSLNDLDTRTPLNGEYSVTAVNEDGKRFQYTIAGNPIANRTSRTGGVARISGTGKTSVANMFFYKVVADENGNAIPVKLWSGTGKIIPDDGKFTGQYRFSGEENSTVFDLSAEYIKKGSAKVFYLYLNGSQVATVTDENPLVDYNNMGLFVRGSSRCMFENIYAIGANLGQNSTVPIAEPMSNVWGDVEIGASEALRKYAMSGIIQKTYLSGISSQAPPSHRLYFDEFGTILREALYVNIKYDRAFPALYARVSKTFNKIKGYVISGFYAGSYGADFLIFNSTDAPLKLDDTSGNFLRIEGIAFTQNTTNTLTFDDYYKNIANFADPFISADGTLVDPNITKEEYNRIINSRVKYGVNEFNITSQYIQTSDAAEDIFGWTINKVSKPKTLVGLNTFATQNLQLGDIVQINYKNNEGIDVISDENKRFVIYNMEYSKSAEEENSTMFLVEV
jgi:hypothetical protein